MYLKTDDSVDKPFPSPLSVFRSRIGTSNCLKSVSKMFGAAKSSLAAYALRALGYVLTVLWTRLHG